MSERAGHGQDMPTLPLAEAIVTLLQLQGLDIDAGRLTAGLPILDGKLPEDQMDRAIQGVGHHAVWASPKVFGQLKCPCCIEMGNGAFAIMVAHGDQGVYLLDTDQPDAYHLLPEAEVVQYYTGRVFNLLPSMDLLLSRHVAGVEKGHWFWGRLFLERLRFTDIIVSSLLANILAVVTSLFALQVYDRVIPGQSEATLWVLASGVVCAIAFEAILRLSRARLVDQMGKDAEVEISRDLFRRVVGMRLDQRPTSPAGIVHMVREFGSVKEFFTTASIGVVADLPFVFIFLALIYSIAGNVVWVVIAGALLTLVPSIVLQRMMARLSRETMGGMAAASRVMTESAYGLESIKAARSEAYFQRQWEDIITLNASKTTDQRFLSAFQSFWGAGVQQVTYVATLIAGVYMVFAGDLTVGAIIAISILSTRTLSPVTQLSQVLARWQNMKNALDGLDQIMAAPQDRDPSRTYFRRARFEGKIQINKLRFSHRDVVTPALDIEELTIQPGTRLALIGKNGSGKSTLLRVLAGLYAPSEGEILLDGLDLRQIDPSDLRRSIAYLPQETRLFRGSLRDNLATARNGANDEMLMEALGFAGLGDVVQHHPEGLDLQIQDGGEGMSIGQRQSVGLARLYLLDPSIILLDEPTAALDQTLENTLVPRIGDWIGRRTCIVATHRPQILGQMTRIAVMHGGKIAVEGDRDSILKGLSAKSAATDPQDSGVET